MIASTVIKARKALIEGIYYILDNPPSDEDRAKIADWLLAGDYISEAFFLEYGGGDE